MSNFLDEAPGYAKPFPFPAGEEAEPEELEIGDEHDWSVACPAKRFRLKELRGKGNIGPKGKTVINVVARALIGENDSHDYDHEGEVAYWFDPKRLDNLKDGQRRDAAALGKFMVALGLLEESDFAGKLTGSTICQLLLKGSAPKSPAAEFTSTLLWWKRAYKGNDGNKYYDRGNAFRGGFHKVELIEEEPVIPTESEDLPF